VEGRETIPAPVVTSAVEVAPGAAVVASPVVPTVVVASVVVVAVVARVVVASSLQNWQVASATQLQRPQST